MQQTNSKKQQNDGDRAYYDRYAANIFAYLCQQIPSVQDAEDILAEVFTAAFKAGYFAHAAPEQHLAWLHRVARNKVIDRYRHDSQFTMIPFEQLAESEDDQLLPEQHILQQEDYQQLHHLLEQLSPLQQELIRLRYNNGLRLTEIARMLNKSEGAVRTLLSRTLHQLRAMYEQAERRTNA